MTAISDNSAASLTRAFEAAQRPQDTGIADDAIYQPDNGMTDCWPIPGDDGPIERLPENWPSEPGPSDTPEWDCLPMPKDREMYVDEQGQIGWRVVVDGTSGDDTIDVTRNPDGSADVTINGETTHYSAEDAQNMRINGGAGNDTITVTDNRGLFGRIGNGDITVEGGSGDDNISGDLDGVNTDGGTGSDTVNGMPELDFDFPINPVPLERGEIEAKPFELDKPVADTPV